MSQLDILHQDNDIIVVNKTAGLITEASPYESVTVESQVFDYISQQKKKPYLGIIHRLDRVTSGVLVLAKKKNVLVTFNELFSSRKVQKTYLAVVKDKPQKNQGSLVNFLVKNNKAKKAEVVVTKTKTAQHAQLRYRLIGKNEHGYLLEVQPKTGRFHQIRAQLAHTGLPIIGDNKYGSDQQYKPQCICLHAWKLRYTPTGTNDPITFEAPLPKHKFWAFDLQKQRN